MLPTVGLEAMRKPVVQFVDIFNKVVARVALAAESLRMMAGSTIFPSELSGKLMLMLPTGLMYQQRHFCRPGMAQGTFGRRPCAIVTLETVIHCRIVRGCQLCGCLVHIYMT